MGDLINFNSPAAVKLPFDTLQSHTNNTTTPNRSFDFFNNSFSNAFDLGRESMPGTGRPSITGRESLQILTDLPRLSEAALSLIPTTSTDLFPKFSADFPERPSLTGRESLQILHDLHNLQDLDVDCGRESLGIIQVKSPQFKYDGEFLRPLDVFIGNSNLSLSPLNTAFLHPSLCGSKKSTISSVSSLFTNSLEPEISKIYSISTIGSTGTEFNLGFMESKPESPKVNVRERGHSAATAENQGNVLGDASRRRCVSELNKKSSLNGSKRSSSLNEENDDVFYDSIFIEAHHLASKMADGSILDESFETNNILDSTPHPEWDTSEEPEEEQPKSKTEDVFKTVDKLLPVIKLNDSTSEIANNNKSNNSKNNSRNECMQNLSDIFNNEKRINVSRASSTSAGSKSRDAKEILQNLSLILTSDSLDTEQKLAGQNLLYNLADILCADEEEKKCESFEDSGHSSFEAEENKVNGEQDHKSFEVLDLRVGMKHKDKPIDLSMRSKGLSHSFSFPSPKMPPPKLSNNLKSQVEAMKRITASTESNISKNSRLNELCNSGIGSKFKPKKNEEKVASTKKGPLRAIIPLNVMAKKKEIETVPKSRRSKVDETPPKKLLQEPISKLKRTSTPINDSKLKPMAQSTPDDCNRYTGSNAQIKKKYTCPVSPLARPQIKAKLGTPTSLNKSDSLPDIVNNNNSNTSDADAKKGLNRRKSASDLKTSNVRMPIKRSYSIGKENHLSSLRRPVDKGKPILENDPKVEQKKIPIRDNSNRSLIKPFNLMSKLKGSRKSEKPIPS